MILRRTGNRTSHIFSELIHEGEIRIDRLTSDGGESDTEGVGQPTSDDTLDDRTYPEIQYDDPWKIFAGWSYATAYEMRTPQIFVWAGGCSRLTDRLQPAWFGSDRKNTCEFTQVSSADELMYFISRHTFFGHRIQVARRSGKSQRPRDPIKNFAETLWRRLGHFLRGRHDPLLSREEREELFVKPDELRSTPERAKRLVEVLKTVDGLFLQRFLAFPEEQWSWEKFDLFILQAIQILITDEFLDGELTAKAMGIQTEYSKLKASRKLVKLVLHKDKPTLHTAELKGVPRWVQDMLGPAWDRACKLIGQQRIYVAGLLSQTRGAGTPPPLVVLQSKEKFLKTVTSQPEDLTRPQYFMILKALNDVMGEIPGHIFTGLDTKARIVVTGSGCWENTRREGGTAEAILHLMAKWDSWPIPIRNLDTGIITEYKHKLTFGSLGEAVFWACLDDILMNPPEDSRKVFLTLVKEPGKARSVTKGQASLKIVLDTINKICAWPLRKGVKSSESGMGKSNHGWNLFRDMFSEEMYPDIFDEEIREDEEFVGYVERLITWRNVFASSTDYQEATDKIVHSVAKLIAEHWMLKCGIPPILRGIVHSSCFMPRTVYYNGSGHLSTYGTPTDIGGVYTVTLRRGILMGDPLTKVILHFTNILARRIGTSVADGTIFSPFVNAAELQDLAVSVLQGPYPIHGHES